MHIQTFLRKRFVNTFLNVSTSCRTFAGSFEHLGSEEMKELTYRSQSLNMNNLIVFCTYVEVERSIALHH